jgi:hypothetical protein
MHRLSPTGRTATVTFSTKSTRSIRYTPYHSREKQTTSRVSRRNSSANLENTMRCLKPSAKTPKETLSCFRISLSSLIRKPQIKRCTKALNLKVDLRLILKNTLRSAAKLIHLISTHLTRKNSFHTSIKNAS